MGDGRSATSIEFRDTVRRWLTANSELLVLNRVNRAAGRKNWFLIRSVAELDAVITHSRPSDCLTVFSQPQLTHRATAGAPDTTPAALSLVSETDEAVFGEIVDGDPELRDAFVGVPGDEGWVSQWLGERLGATVAFGEYPPFLDPDPDISIDGIVPNADGSVTPGVY